MPFGGAQDRQLGVDRLLARQSELLSGKRVGLLAHGASIGTSGEQTVSRLLAGVEWDLTALFGPEHGVETKAQDMEPVASTEDRQGKIPIYSLYGNDSASLSPTPEMLQDIDVLVVDLQDIGTRFYTYVWTAILCMKACAALGKEVIVCDRPNPLGGIQVEGPGIKPGFESFVGLYSIPVRHGMTIGEIASYLNEREKIGCQLHVVPMEDWRREWHWPDTGLSWVNPSPNMRSYHAALLYPGMCLLEATNCSEGRGTEAPFERIGAPYIRSGELIEHFAELQLPGIAVTSCELTPTRQKHAGQPCEGVRWRVTDRQAFRPYLTGLALIWLLHRLYSKKGFAWRTEPYEFVKAVPAIDLLSGSATLRERITTRDFEEIAPLATAPALFQDERQPYLLYS